MADESKLIVLSFTLNEQINKIVQYVSALHTFETCVKYHNKECSTSICD